MKPIARVSMTLKDVRGVLAAGGLGHGVLVANPQLVVQLNARGIAMADLVRGLNVIEAAAKAAGWKMEGN